MPESAASSRRTSSATLPRSLNVGPMMESSALCMIPARLRPGLGDGCQGASQGQVGPEGLRLMAEKAEIDDKAGNHRQAQADPKHPAHRAGFHALTGFDRVQ